MTNKQTAIAIGRVTLASLFVLGGTNKILNYSATSNVMEAQGIPFIALLLPTVICLELIGGALVALGLRPIGGFAAILLAAFTVTVNFVFHDFWNFSDPFQRQLELSLFFKNVAISGGLILIAAQLSESKEKGEKEANASRTD